MTTETGEPEITKQDMEQAMITLLHAMIAINARIEGMEKWIESQKSLPSK